ncbi:hypothetical protein GCM10023188_44510 [Pontibacter saemangeumensis]|uniref:Uncharacterized protein n=1 Tax=Pontibacter saemangeumensis TaxID=1084525 RepID=A0ABP8M331_9BACT
MAYIRLAIAILLLCTWTNLYAAPEDTLISKAYIQSLEEKVQRLESNTGDSELSSERWDLLNDKIENLQGETERSEML